MEEVTTITIILNGETRQIAAAATISDILRILQLDPRYVAVEVNRQVIPRARHPVFTLVEGDRVEVVTLVGGG